MRINSDRIKAEREKRAWSQAHLAEVSGLGLRSINRIEAKGKASLESIKALAAVFEVDVAELRVNGAADVTIPEGLTWTLLLKELLTSPVKLLKDSKTGKTNRVRLLTTTLCLIGAGVSYGLGFSAGIGAFIAIGMVFEIALWFRLTEGSRQQRS